MWTFPGKFPRRSDIYLVMKGDYQFTWLRRQVDRKELSKKKNKEKTPKHKGMKVQIVSKVMTCFICEKVRVVGCSSVPRR